MNKTRGRRLLVLTTTLIALLIAAGLAAPWLAPFGMQDIDAGGITASGQILVMPLPPGFHGHLLGTDAHGRDIFSRLLYGIPYTVGLALGVSALRLAAGLPLGLAAGWQGGWLASWLENTESVASGIPAVIAALIVLQTLNAQALSFWIMMTGYAVVLGGLGFLRVGMQVKRETEQASRQEFVAASIALGQRPVSVIRRHILPQLLPMLSVQFALETASTLLLLAQLGLLGVFIGGGWQIQLDNNTFTRTDLFPEWSQMLASARSQIISAPWIPLFTGLAFILAIGLFTLTGEALRMYWQRHQPSRWL